MSNYYRVRLGKGNNRADVALESGFIGANYGVAEDLSPYLTDDSRAFRRVYFERYQELHPAVTRRQAGARLGQLWLVCCGLQEGDTVLMPTPAGVCHVGVVDGPYRFVSGDGHPHQRAVRWSTGTISRTDMSAELRATVDTPNTVCSLEGHAAELEAIFGRTTGLAGESALAGHSVQVRHTNVESRASEIAAFEFERQLEDFLVTNWDRTDFGRDYDLVEGEHELKNRQFPTDTGPIDILALSKDGTTYLVIELKRGRASDAAVGQTLRYMSYVREVLAEDGQHVRGAIVAADDSPRLRRAISEIKAIDFYHYSVQFTLRRSE